MGGDVFALVGKRFDLPWRQLEAQPDRSGGRAAGALGPEDRAATRAGKRDQFVLATKNVREIDLIRKLLAEHDGEQILILGTYLDQLEWVSRVLRSLVSGQTSGRSATASSGPAGRGVRPGTVKVGNFAVDLPGATVASNRGTWGSR